MVEISMSSEAPPAGAVGYQNQMEPVVESMSASDNMTHSYGDLRQSGEWTVVTCRCCSSPSSLSDEPSAPGVDKLICTCSNISNIPADCSSNDSSSDVAVINESDIDELSQKDNFDMDGIQRISSLSLLSDKSHVNVFSESIKTNDDKQVDTDFTVSENSLPKTSRLRLRLKNFPSSSRSSVESTNDGLSSFSEQRRIYKKSNKKSRRNKISDESVITMERTITFLLCLILTSCIIAFSCFVFTFFARYFDQAKQIPSKKSPVFTDVEELEKEFTKCFDLKAKGQDCKLNLNLWKKSLVELLADENQRISKLIQKLDQVDETTKHEKESVPLFDKPVGEKVPIENGLEMNPVSYTEPVNQNIPFCGKPIEEKVPIETIEYSNIQPENDNFPYPDNSIQEKIPIETIENSPDSKDPVLELFENANKQLRILASLVKKRPEIFTAFSWVEKVQFHSDEIKDSTPSSDKHTDENTPIEMEKSSEINSDLNDFLKKLEPDIPPAQKGFINIPEYDADSTSKNHFSDEIRQNQKMPNHMRQPYSDIEDESDDDVIVDDEYEDIESDDGTETDEEQNERETLESLKKQMEALRNLYDLEKTENEKLKKVFEDQKQEQPPKEEEEETEESNDFLGMGNLFPDSVWKNLKNTANNLNPHLEKFRKKLAKAIKDKISGARELSDHLRKKWDKNSEIIAKRLKKLQKAWNEEDTCDKDSPDCHENDIKNEENIKDTLNELNSKADWYTKRFAGLKGESQDNLPENSPANWVFKRAKGREEMHDTSKNNKKQKKTKNDNVKKKKKGKHE